MPRPLLELDRVSVSIGPTTVLSEVSVGVRPGECLVLVGETGSGKSMVCRVATGLLDRIGGRITAGSAQFDDVLLDPSAPDRSQLSRIRGRRLALIPQVSLSSLDPLMRVGKQMQETVRALHPRVDTKAKSRELLASVRLADVDHVMHAYPHQLSGGMRQRVMIALALAGDPELLIADEPTTALDVTVQSEILSLLTELRRERGMALLMVTHDMSVVAEVANRVAVMYRGRIIERGLTHRVLNDPQHAYTAALLASRPATATRGEPLAVPRTGAYDIDGIEADRS